MNELDERLKFRNHKTKRLGYLIIVLIFTIILAESDIITLNDITLGLIP